MQFEVINGDKKTICEVMATYHDDNLNKDYMVYTDMTYDKDKKLNIYYSLYKEVDGGIELIDIVNEEDKAIGLDLIKRFVNNIK